MGQLRTKTKTLSARKKPYFAYLQQINPIMAGKPP